MDSYTKTQMIQEELNRINEKRRKNFVNISASQAKWLEDLLNTPMQGDGTKFIQYIHDAHYKEFEQRYRKKLAEAEQALSDNVNPNNNSNNEEQILKNSQQTLDQAKKRTNIQIQNLIKFIDKISSINAIDEAQDLQKKQQEALLRIYKDYMNDPNIDAADKPLPSQMAFSKANLQRMNQYVAKKNNDTSNPFGEGPNSAALAAFNELLGIQATLKKASAANCLPQKDLGDAFEYALNDFITMLSQQSGYIEQALIRDFINNFLDNNSDFIRTNKSMKTLYKQAQKYVDDIAFPTLSGNMRSFSGVTGGDRTKSQDSIKIENIKIDSNFQLQGKEQETSDQKEKKSKIFTFSQKVILQPDSSRQGKMDVSWVLVEPGKQRLDLKISAKNWQKLSGHELGSTSILYALIRSSSDSYAKFYELGLQDYGLTGGAIDVFHNFAKLCIAVDIAMGYSQQNGYANLLVVYDRTANYVYVRSMQDLLDTICDEAGALYASGYVDIELQQLAHQIRQQVIKQERADPNTESTQLYYDYMHQLLNQIKVKISVSSSAFLKMKTT